MERQEGQDKTVRLLKQQLKSYVERLEEFEGNLSRCSVFIILLNTIV